MPENKHIKRLLLTILLTGLGIRIYVILRYGNLLTLDSDDLNYIKSAVHFMKSGMLTYQNYNEPTVYIMPVYPVFLAAVFKVTGYGCTGFQIVRILQACISIITVILVFAVAKVFFKEIVALPAAAFMSFYLPNVTSAGYIMTETLFAFLLMLLVYFSVRFLKNPKLLKFVTIGIISGIVTLCRPTIALYPVLLIFGMLFLYKFRIGYVVKLGIVMIVGFCLIMSPWWLRNYFEYSRFIPLAASSGNPMLQGTYIGYKQTPENITYYKLGENALETDHNEVEAAKMRIASGFKKDFWAYLKWYTVGKTRYFWGTIFYWKEVMDISQYSVLAMHYIILTGFIGIGILTIQKDYKALFPAVVILYFNASHCIFMAFDRYAFPVLPLLAVYASYYIIYTHEKLILLAGYKAKGNEV